MNDTKPSPEGKPVELGNVELTECISRLTQAVVVLSQKIDGVSSGVKAERAITEILLPGKAT
jgi:hypothetical protein